MKTLFLILFFSKFILLSPEPITLDSKWIEIVPKKTFSAITGGASIRIQIPVDDPRIKKIEKEKDTFEQLDKLFPDGSIEAYIYGEKNYVVYLSEMGFSISDFNFEEEESLHIILSPSFSMPTKIEFNRLEIKSNIKMENVKIYWKNFTM